MREFDLTAEQSRAVDWVFDFVEGPEKTALLEGPAGSGKTTVLSEVIAGMGSAVKATAPTHKAARVLGESFDRKWLTSTIHSALGLKKNIDEAQVRFLSGGERPRWWGSERVLLFVVDEASMIGEVLWNLTQRVCLETPTKVLFVGDECQSPPVVPGTRIQAPSRVFTDVPQRMSLEMVMRHGSGIQEFANRIRKNIHAGVERWDYEQIPGAVEIVRTREEFNERFLDATRRLDREARAVAWKNSEVDTLNKMVRKAVVGEERANNEKFIAGEIVTVAGNPVMESVGGRNRIHMYVEDEAVVIQHDIVSERRLDFKYAPNGEFQYHRLVLENITNPNGNRFVAKVPTEHSRDVLKMWVIEKEKAALRAKTAAKWQEYHKANEYMDDIRHNQAMTVHKSQGSSYTEMYIDVTQFMENDDPLTAMKLFYVGVTRARKLAVVYFGEGW